jgi:DNA-binding XRE family transcriptional regulator
MKKKKRAAGRARGVTAAPTKASPPPQAAPAAKSKKAAASEPILKNRVRETRIERMMSKAELARRAGISVLTIDRVEKGLGCRMDTKRKILEALGLSLADRVRVFGEEE